MVYPKPPAILQGRDLRPADLAADLPAALLRTYAWMQLARTADNRILELFRQGLIRGTVTGGQGNEGLIVPLALLANKEVDVISITHRGLGAHLIWSGHLVDHLNQYFANAASPTKAREGNVHHGDPKNRSLPMISHLGIMVSNVVGATDSQRRFGRPAMGFAFLGDGSSSKGDVHESLNLATLLGVPILFVIENNRYAYSTPVSEQFAANVELWRRAAGYGIEGWVLDCTADVAVTLKRFAAAIDQVHRTGRPLLIEANTLRLRGHAAYDTCDYLKPGESDAMFAADPLPKFRARLSADGEAAKLDALDAEIAAFVEDCLKVAMAVPRPDPAGMENDLFAPPGPPLPWVPSVDSEDRSQKAEVSGQGSGPRTLNSEPKTEIVTMAQALNRALRKILTECPESVVLGQDIATYGGAFKVTEGLLKDFGRPRVLNTPLSESGSTGYAIGLALNGHRPIEEFQFADFSTEATTQIVLNAATFHFRSGAAVPLVLRLPCGGGLTFGSFHSQELESFYLAIPGLKALYPSNPQDAFNALLAAFEDGNPVMLFEHKGLYRRGKQPITWDPNYRDVWNPKRVRPGDFATLITYGEMVHFAGEVCDYFAAEYERSFELWDLRALAPLKLDAIKESLARTHRLIVLHEGRLTHGFGAELVARLTGEFFYALEAPPLRLGALDLPVPFAPELEAAFRPTKDKVIAAIANWLG
ncbi:MAG TPA: thiamine pyrophosphate-dependent enzyme [Opitutaceae bacterium]|nr:thiamine pyrophosphate-dependent enzyme [Opitutaceae bacterium]